MIKLQKKILHKIVHDLLCMKLNRNYISNIVFEGKTIFLGTLNLVSLLHLFGTEEYRYHNNIILTEQYMKRFASSQQDSSFTINYFKIIFGI